MTNATRCCAWASVAANDSKIKESPIAWRTIDFRRSAKLMMLLRRSIGDHSRLLVGNDHLDGVFDPVAGVAECGRQIGEPESMGVNPGCIKTHFRHQGHGAAGGATAFAANAIDVDVVLHQ